MGQARYARGVVGETPTTTLGTSVLPTEPTAAPPSFRSLRENDKSSSPQDAATSSPEITGLHQHLHRHLGGSEARATRTSMLPVPVRIAHRAC